MKDLGDAAPMAPGLLDRGFRRESGIVKFQEVVGGWRLSHLGAPLDKAD